MNKVVLLGRMTKDIEVRQGGSGSSFGKFTIAVDRPFKKGETDFINCTAFGKTCDVISSYVQKGSQIAVEGALQISKYAKEDGTNGYSTDIIVNSVSLISGAKSNEPTQGDDYPFN